MLNSALGLAGIASTFVLFGVLFGELWRDGHPRPEEFRWYRFAFFVSMAGLVSLPIAVGMEFKADPWYHNLLRTLVLVASICLEVVAFGIWRTKRKLRDLREEERRHREDERRRREEEEKYKYALQVQTRAERAKFIADIQRQTDAVRHEVTLLQG